FLPAPATHPVPATRPEPRPGRGASPARDNAAPARDSLDRWRANGPTRPLHHRSDRGSAATSPTPTARRCTADPPPAPARTTRSLPRRRLRLFRAVRRGLARRGPGPARAAEVWGRQERALRRWVRAPQRRAPAWAWMRSLRI